MLPRVRFGKTGLEVGRIALGGYPFGGVNKARGWDPFSPEGRAEAVRTIHAAIDLGVNYLDTAPSYGNGNSESIYGEALVGRRDKVLLASKVGYAKLTPDDVRTSVETSLRRLRTDHLDVIQFHGGMYSEADVAHVLREGLVDMLETLRAAGKVRFIGFTTEEPWTARPLIASGRFAMVQLRYNLIFQAAALHALDEAKAADMGVATMRPMTSGVFQRIASYLAPQWSEGELYELALKFVLSDTRVHLPIVGMRWAHEVEKNVRLVERFQAPFDMAELPRWTAEIYRTEDVAASQR